MVRRGLYRACLTKDVTQCFIARHDVYGEKFMSKFVKKLAESVSLSTELEGPGLMVEDCEPQDELIVVDD